MEQGNEWLELKTQSPTSEAQSNASSAKLPISSKTRHVQVHRSRGGGERANFDGDTVNTSTNTSSGSIDESDKSGSTPKKTTVGERRSKEKSKRGSQSQEIRVRVGERSWERDGLKDEGREMNKTREIDRIRTRHNEVATNCSRKGKGLSSIPGEGTVERAKKSGDKGLKKDNKGKGKDDGFNLTGSYLLIYPLKQLRMLLDLALSNSASKCGMYSILAPLPSFVSFLCSFSHFKAFTYPGPLHSRQ
jgi:hypothetical protein